MDLSALTWQSEFRLPVILLVTAMVVYPFSYFALGIGALRWVLGRLGITGDPLAIWSVILSRVTGALVLAVAPVLVAVGFDIEAPQRFGFSLDHFGLSMIFTAVGIVGAGSVEYLGYRVWSGAFALYPEIKVAHWGPRLLSLNFLGWAIYLGAYEFLFRGFLLFPFASTWGTWPAIALTTVLYSYTHIAKSPQETVATMMLGYYFAAVTLITGSFLCPFLVHVFIACSSEVFAILANPKMTISLRGQRSPDQSSSQV